MLVEFHSSLEFDLDEVISYYDHWKSGLGAEFGNEVRAVIDRIRLDPQLFADVDGIRLAHMNRFPYTVGFRIVDQDRLRILFIRHQKRHPSYGLHRK